MKIIIFNGIKAYMFSYFLSQILIKKDKKKYMYLSLVLQLLCCFFCWSSELNAYFFNYLTILIHIVCVYMCHLSISLENVLLIMSYKVIITSLDVFGFLIRGIIEGVEMLSLSYFTYQSWLTDFFSIVLSGIVTFIWIYTKKHIKTSLKWKQWSFVFLYVFLLLMGIVYVIYALSFSKNRILYVALFFFVLLFCLFFVIIYKFIQLDQKNIEMIHKKQSDDFLKQQHYTLSQINDDINNKEHRFYYALFQIEHFLKLHQYEKIYPIVNEYRTLLTKRKIMIQTKNPIFDNLFSTTLNHFILKGIDVQVAIFISQNYFYEQYHFISQCIDIVYFFDSAKVLKMMMYEKNDYFLLHIISNEIKKKSQLEVYLKQKFIDYKIYENEIKIIIPIQNKNATH